MREVRVKVRGSDVTFCWELPGFCRGASRREETISGNSRRSGGQMMLLLGTPVFCRRREETCREILGGAGVQSFGSGAWELPGFPGFKGSHAWFWCLHSKFLVFRGLGATRKEHRATGLGF